MSIRNAELGNLMRLVRKICREKGQGAVSTDADVLRLMNQCLRFGIPDHEIKLMIEAALETAN